MKRNAGLALIAVVAISISLLLIPTSFARRAGNSAGPADAVPNTRSEPAEPGALKNFRRQESQSLIPISAPAVNFAVSTPVRDLPNAKDLKHNFKSEISEGEGEGGGREVNELNALRVKTERAGGGLKLQSLDGALQSSKPIVSETPSTPSLTFDGLSDADNESLIGFRIIPSDANIDVGPNDVIQTVNDGFRVWDKFGNPKISPKLISSLFTKLGGICATADRGDPVVLYDRMADRWFITQFAFLGAGQEPPFHQCVAVSQNSDPLGSYYTYDFVTPGAEFPDYGKFGVWPDGYYMTVNQFTEPGDNFNGVGAYALDRKKMLVGDPTAAFIYFNLNSTSHPEFIYSAIPSDQDGLQPPPPGAPNVFAYLISDEFEAPPFKKDALRLFDFHADFTTPANSTFSERSESPVLVSAFDPRSAPGNSDVKQPAPAAGEDSLDSIEYHLMNRLQYQNRGGIETLVSSTTVNVSGATPSTTDLYQAGVRYFVLQRSSPSAPFLLYDNATFSPDAGNPATGVNRWLPSAALDNQGNLALTYSASGPSVFPSIWYAGRDFNAVGGLTGETHMFDGTGVQLGSFNRWGDYQSLQVDPSDDCTFWTTNQYYSTNAEFDWKTRIGRFKFPTCQAPAQGTVKGTIKACDSDVGIAGAIVQLSNGFSATTKVDGTYSIKVAPGTYSLTVSNGARSCNASSSTSITISDGGTTTFDSCLNGIGKLVPDPNVPDPITISGGNGNGFIDADECNNLIVSLRNLGCAPARSITATLTSSTPGVTIAQPKATYADLSLDGVASNTVPFSVTTSPSFVCGTTINFTLTTTFTGGSTVSTFSLPTCNEPQPGIRQDVIVSGSIDPTDAKTALGRIGRDGVASSCGSVKACPEPIGTGVRSFDQYSFANGPTPQCVTITLSSVGGANLVGSSYLGSYNPADTTFCTNYLGDPGNSSNTESWKVDVPANGNLVVVVTEVNTGTASTPYTVTVSGLSAAPTVGNGGCQACTITPPQNLIVNNDPGTCGAVVNFPAPTTTGTCGAVTLSKNSGTIFPVGTTTVTATSGSGATATFTITVKDNQKPVVTVPSNITVSTDAGQCSATVNPGAPTATDNCPGTTFTSVRSDSQPLNAPYPKGTTTITWTATDAAGNTNSGTQSVTVNDTTMPVIACPSNITVNPSPGASSAVVNYNVAATDNCAAVTLTTNPVSGSTFNVGTTPVTATATDAAGRTATCTFNVTVNPVQAFQFSSPSFAVNESGGNAILTVTRSGVTSGTGSVDFATSDGTATQKGDYIIKLGTLQFAAGETSKTILVPIVDDAYLEGNENFTVTLSNPAGTNAILNGNTSTIVTIMDNETSSPTTNPIDDAQFFVRQQYLDFLNRQPDSGGLAFWTDQITSCGSDATCVSQRRIDVSAAFFGSQEFKDTGFFVYLLHNILLGRQPTYLEFMTDLSNLPASPNIVQLEQAYTELFLQRAAVLSTFPLSQTRDQFIDALLQRLSSAGVNLSSKRSELVAEYDAGTNQINSRGRVVFKLTTYPEYTQTQFNSAFVLTEYFGYLRRDPETGGFQFWLNVLNTTGNSRGMVCSFLTSAEYQDRFSSIRTRNNSQCSSLAP